MSLVAVCTRVCWGLEMHVEIKTWTERGGGSKESCCKQCRYTRRVEMNMRAEEMEKGGGRDGGMRGRRVRVDGGLGCKQCNYCD